MGKGKAKYKRLAVDALSSHWQNLLAGGQANAFSPLLILIRPWPLPCACCIPP